MLISYLKALTLSRSPIWTMRMPVRLSVQFARLQKLLDAELAIFEKERKKLADAHGGTLPPGAQDLKFKSPENHQAFMTEFQALLDSEFDLSCIYFPMPLSALGQVDLSSSDLLALEDFVTLPEDDEEAEDPEAELPPAPNPAPKPKGAPIPLKPAPKKRR